jgi:hypothetical protein
VNVICYLCPAPRVPRQPVVTHQHFHRVETPLNRKQTMLLYLSVGDLVSVFSNCLSTTRSGIDAVSSEHKLSLLTSCTRPSVVSCTSACGCKPAIPYLSNCSFAIRSHLDAGFGISPQPSEYILDLTVHSGLASGRLRVCRE